MIMAVHIHIRLRDLRERRSFKPNGNQNRRRRCVPSYFLLGGVLRFAASRSHEVRQQIYRQREHYRRVFLGGNCVQGLQINSKQSLVKI
jgi:hypothetical protein